ncbi:hypothetical protein [Amycolatopsis dendrobii]|uniref:Uncharacterized protein n=1 Tax=Amycolatopsis dendrobii TaxID=2760662 RepID=A0A7W3VSR4_9PSEU|nr:hypothetical protein [Amycolatopsis dendrobii]MBB1152498.1 hypothetical protein [Amycolatopsis dendrobii]
MKHEGAPPAATPEQHDERERLNSPFDLEKMEPRQIAGLVSALALAEKTQFEREGSPLSDGSAELHMYNELLDDLMDDLSKNGADLSNALDVYREMAVGELASEYSRGPAVEMAVDLLRRNTGNPEVKAQIVEGIVAILQSEGLGQEVAVADGVVPRLVWADWLDESTARYLDSHISNEDFRRW